MEIGLGILGWSPAEFWDASNKEFLAAISGWNEKNGEKPKVTVEEIEKRREIFDKVPDTVPSLKKLQAIRGVEEDAGRAIERLIDQTAR